MNLNELETVGQFLNDNSVSGDLTEEVALNIEKLFNEYKLPRMQSKCSIISVDTGVLGSIVVQDIDSFKDNVEFQYKRGDYDRISIKSNRLRAILWTDYSDVEPYNRQGGLYCDGLSFKTLGEPIIETSAYREFRCDINSKQSISFGVDGFSYNKFWNTLKFGICIETVKVEDFILELRKLLKKYIHISKKHS